MSLFVKICGLARAADVEAVAALEPDAIGFIFWPSSPRYVAPDQVAGWTRDLPASIKKVGVFVDLAPEEVARTVATANLDVAQLHGEEPLATCEALGCEVWKAVHLDKPLPADLERYPVDAFLLDSYSAVSPGGTGMLVDWERAATFIGDVSSPVLLAGGLTAENVAEGVRATGAWGVDVSSGVETAPGKKDVEKVRKFIEQCRNL